MSAKRRSGKYTINLKWRPEHRGPAWVLGDYKFSIRQPESRHNIEDHTFIIWKGEQPSGATYGATAQALGLSENAMGSSHAYDVVARRIVEDLHERWPNRILFQEILEHGIRRGR